ncbi:MAG: RNA methyltransferase [Anaerolineales bacterium]|jgi:TrmH family RNA methyltransferase
MITSTHNQHVKWIRRLQKRRRARHREGVFVVEGVRLVREAVAAQWPARMVLHTDKLDERGRGLVNNLARLGAEVHAVSPAVMSACSDTESAPGLLAVLELPEFELPQQPTLIVVVDGITDPGNLGTLLRTCLAVRVQAVLYTEGTVDPFNAKVVRGGMGAHFRLPIVPVALDKLQAHLDDMELWLAMPGQGVPYHEVDWRLSSALVIGNEAHGPQPALQDMIPKRVHIPMPGETESINVAIAAAVILFEIVRQRGLQ